MSSLYEDPLCTVNEYRWIVISDEYGNPLHGRVLYPPVDQRRALSIARKIFVDEGFEAEPVSDHPYVRAWKESERLLISLEEDPP